MSGKFGRPTARPVFSLSAFKRCVEILPARIGTVFGNSWRNKVLGRSARRISITKAGVILEAFVPNAWRLAELYGR